MQKLALLFFALLLFLPDVSMAAEAVWPMFGNNPQHNAESPYVGPGKNAAFVQTIDTGLQPGDTGGVVLGADNTIYFAGRYYEGAIYKGALHAYNPDGTLKWRYLFPRFPIGSSTTPAIDSAGVVYVTSQEYGTTDFYLHAVSPAGELLWELNIGGRMIASATVVVGADGTIYLGGSKVTAVNPDGTIKLKYDCAHQCGTIALSPDESTIYTLSAENPTQDGSPNNLLLALTRDGAYSWKLDLGDGSYETNYLSPITVDKHGTIYIPATRAYPASPSLYAVNPNGTLKWEYVTKDNKGHTTYIMPTTSQDGDVYFLQGVEPKIYGNIAHLYSLDNRGRLNWRYEVPEYCQSNAPAIDADGNIYFGIFDPATVYSLSSRGSLNWSLNAKKIHPDANFWAHSPAIGSDGRIYINGDNIIYIIGE